MGNIKVSKEVSEALSKLIDVIVKDCDISLQKQPTEKLINDMQSILDELKRRVSFPATKTLRNLPVGAKVVDKNTKYYGAPIVWQIADHDYYEHGLTTLVSERILTFKAFDAAEPNNPDEWRSDCGNNDYLTSNIKLWLNSYKEDWFMPLHEFDQAPTEDYVYGRPYADEKGFLSNFSEDFVKHINDSVLGKVFLLSAEEVGLSDKGKPLALFVNNDSRKAKPTRECVKIDGEGLSYEADWWWLRTPNAERSNYVYYVTAYGALSDNSAFHGYNGVRPALNLPSEIRVKAEPNENGIYEIVWC